MLSIFAILVPAVLGEVYYFLGSSVTYGFGSSTGTNGWARLTADVIEQNCGDEAYVLGTYGQTTGRGMAMYNPQEVAQNGYKGHPKPDVVVLSYSIANEAGEICNGRELCKGAQDAFQRNLPMWAADWENNGVKVILGGIYCSQDRKEEELDMMEETRQFVKSLPYDYFDFMPACDSRGKWRSGYQYVRDDGSIDANHPNDRGYEAMAQKPIEWVKARCPGSVCTGHFGQVSGDTTCCGQNKKIVSSSHICGTNKRRCSGFKHGTSWGTCVNQCSASFGSTNQWCLDTYGAGCSASQICGEENWFCSGYVNGKTWGTCKNECMRDHSEGGYGSCPASLPFCLGFVHGVKYGKCRMNRPSQSKATNSFNLMSFSEDTLLLYPLAALGLCSTIYFIAKRHSGSKLEYGTIEEI